jgi:hypothetical protein
MDDAFPDVKTGNGIDRDLAATTNDRLRLMVLELRQLEDGIKALNINVVQLNTSSEKYSRRLIVLTWILVIFTVVLVVMTGMLIMDSRQAVSAQDNIALTAEFFTDINTKIIAAIENNLPILTENHGQFNDVQLDNYLGNFDTIESAYDQKLLSQDDLCDSFSYYIDISSKDTEIQNYIAEQQKQDSEFLTSLAHLASVVSQSKDSNCK